MNPSRDADLHQDGDAPGHGGPAMGPTYVDLLEHARVLQQSAFEHDLTAIHGLLGDLRESLIGRLRTGEDDFDGLSGAVAEVVRSGQRQLTEQIDDLIGRSSIEHPDCRCIEGTSRVASLLRRQARLEAGLRA
jgi:hypothetical protein